MGYIFTQSSFDRISWYWKSITPNPEIQTLCNKLYYEDRNPKMRHTDLPHRINTLLQQKRANVKNWIRIRIIPIFSRSCNACGILLLILLFWPGINGFCQNSDSIKEIFEILARKDNSSIFGKLAKLHENGLFLGKKVRKESVSFCDMQKNKAM